MKQYFIVETSIFLEKNFLKIRFFQWKTPFFQKNASFNRKRGFIVSESTLHLKQYFILETSVFLAKTSRKFRFFQWKRPFCQKNTSFIIEKEDFSYKRVLYIYEIVFYSGNLSFPRKNLLENPFFPVANTVLSEKYKF